jgi:putative glycosyltransferase
MKLSIVTTLYQSSPHIGEFYRRASSCAKKQVGDDYEIVLVNDGSPDDSLAIALQIHEADRHVVVVDLSRNFGHHKAMMSGLSEAKGDRLFLIDSDLEEEPEWLNVFSDKMDSNSSDVIFGVQRIRKGGWFERLSGYVFWFIFNRITGLEMTKNSTTSRLMTRRYVNALLSHEEREVFIDGLWHITGFKQDAQSVEKHSSSQTTYTFRRKMSLLVNAITSFSNLPLIGIFYIGFTISFFSIAYIIFLYFQWIFLASPLGGWTSIMASIWLIGGMVICFMGVLGIYLAKIFSETKRRPYTIIRHIYKK